MIRRCRVGNNGQGSTAGGKGSSSSAGLIDLVEHRYVRKVIVDARNLPPARNCQPMFGACLLLFTGYKVFPGHQQAWSGAIPPDDLIAGLAHQADQPPGDTLAHFFPDGCRFEKSRPAAFRPARGMVKQIYADLLGIIFSAAMLSGRLSACQTDLDGMATVGKPGVAVDADMSLPSGGGGE